MQSPDKIPFYVLLFNIAKKNNLGNLIRTANAFGAEEIIVVGKRNYHQFGSFGTAKRSRKRHFYSLDQALEYLGQLGCCICGVEIAPNAQPIEDATFDQPTAFMVGNEGDGLSPGQIQACERLVYIRQFGSGGSINVNVAAGIVLHRFSVAAGYRENQIAGHKFVPKA